MNKVTHFLRRTSLGSTVAMLILVALWSAPTLGLLITSLRPRDLAEISPWWEALAAPFSTPWSFEAYQNSLASGMLDSLVSTIAVAVPSTILPLMMQGRAVAPAAAPQGGQ